MNVEDLDEVLEEHEVSDLPTRIVVRLSRSFWHDKNGVYQRTALRYLKRQTQGYNFFDDDCDNGGADEAMPRIVNLEACDDGVYQLVMCNVRKDWESGHVDDWDYKLIPLEKDEQKVESTQ